MPLDLGTNIRWALGIVFFVLAASTLTTLVLPMFRRDIAVAETRDRLHAWWIMAGVFTIAAFSPTLISLGLFALISYLALKEYFTLLPMRRVDRTLLFFTYLANPIQYIWVGLGWYVMFIVFIPVIMFVFLPIHLLLTGKPSGFMRSASTLHWGLMATVFSLSHAAYLLRLPRGDTAVLEGAGLLIFLVGLTEFNTVLQFWWGRAMPQSKIAPRINPAKTWGGLAGGVLSTIVIAMLAAPYLTPLSPVQAFWAGLLIALAGFLGDLTISALKRDLRIRQTGHYIPGHGGVLDRVDGLSYTAPVFFHYLNFFLYS